jgi:hypothetical protein
MPEDKPILAIDPPERRDGSPEKLLTLKDAAARLGLPAFKIRRAARLGLFPTYTLLNARRLVRLSEVVAAIERSRTGGVDG